MLKQDIDLFTTKSYQFFETLGVSLAKAKALTLVAVSTNFTEYETSIASDYFNTLLTLLEESSDAFSVIEQSVIRPLKKPDDNKETA